MAYLAAGNEAANPSGAAFDVPVTDPGWYMVDGVDVAATPGQAAIVAFGDSITNGGRSTPDTNRRWPDHLARRLVYRPVNQLSVLNEGIAGNRVLSNTPTYLNAVARLDRDVLAQDGVRYVILLEGVNDIGQACLGNEENTAEDIIGGYRQIITQVHLKGMKIFGATLTPFKGANYYCDDGEGKRGLVNNWIRTSGEFDGVIDFDKATRDPDNLLMYLPDYDSGDHLHPNDAGHESMANAIDLSLFAP